MIGDLDRDVMGMGRERAVQPVLRARGEAFAACAENMADAVERIALAASVAVCLLLDSGATVIDCGPAVLDVVGGVRHAGRVLALVIDRVLGARERVRRRDLVPLGERLAALVRPVSVGFAGSAGDEVENPGRGGGVHGSGRPFR